MSGVSAGGHGVVALGDSFMKGYGLPLAGLSCASWGSWLAWATTSCLTQLAVDGATCEQVLRDQVPLLQHDYRLGVVWLGANDIARLDRALFAQRFTALCSAVAQRCQTVAVTTLPAAITAGDATLGPHEAGRRDVNAVLREVAAGAGAVLVDVEQGLQDPWFMAPDREHPTALGQLAVARAAAHALDAAGFTFARHLPDPHPLRPTASEQALWRRGGWSRLRRVAARSVRPQRPG